MKKWASQIYKACKKSQWQREVGRLRTRRGMETEWQEIGVKEIKNKTEVNGYQDWKKGMEGKSTLRWYRNKKMIGREEWYQGDWAGKLLFKARSDTLELNGRNRDVREQRCQLCNEEKETLEHFIIECEKYRKQRKILDTQIAKIIGRKEWEKRKDGEDRGILTVLGLTNDKDIDKRIVSHVKMFLTESWSARKESITA